MPPRQAGPRLQTPLPALIGFKARMQEIVYYFLLVEAVMQDTAYCTVFLFVHLINKSMKSPDWQLCLRGFCCFSCSEQDFIHFFCLL